MIDDPKISSQCPKLHLLDTPNAFYKENERQVALSLLTFLRDPFGDDARDSLERIEASQRPHRR